MLTQHNDNGRTGQNLEEVELAPDTVNSGQFGRLLQFAVDGDVYTQPLYVAGVPIPDVGVRNVLYVATEHDSVYGFDADAARGSTAPLWKASFIDPNAGISTVPYTAAASTDITPEIGITGTPVIDAAAATLYVVANTKEPAGYVQRLHALDVATGAERAGSPVQIAPQVDGVGDGATNGVVAFDALRENQRPALLLAGGVVYVAWSSHGDHPPYHGWIVGYDARTLEQVAVFNDTPDGSAGGIWLSGGGLAADEGGDIFAATGNGTFDAAVGGRDFSESVLRLTSASGLYPVDSFTPYNYVALNAGDLDLCSSGVVLLPDQGGAHPRLAVAAGKQGTIYLLDRDDLGGFNAEDDSQVVQVLRAAIGPAFGTPAYWNGTVYYAGVNDYPKAFSLTNGQLSPTPVSEALERFGFPGGSPSVSANGPTAGIVWIVQSDGYGMGNPGVLHAYDAANLANELYHSDLTYGSDDAGPAIKFAVPTIANGKVYVPGRQTISVFGLLQPITPAPLVPTVTPTPAPTATPIPNLAVGLCVGDCSGDEQVTIAEVIEGVDIALNLLPTSACPAFACDGDGRVGIDCIVRAVDNAFNGCSS